MINGFYIAATLMVSAATILLIVPTLRAGAKIDRSRGFFLQTTLLALLVPLLALGVYLMTGSPQALTTAAITPPEEAQLVESTIGSLRATAREHPGDLEAWLALGRAASTMKQPDIAVDAYGRAIKLAPNDPDVLVAFVDASVAANASHRVDTIARDVLVRAMDIAPQHQHGLLLLGFAYYQDGHYREAASAWRRLLAQLPPSSAVATAVQREIAEADLLAHSPTRTPP